MSKTNGVSQKTMEAIAQIKQLGGNAKKIDIPAEYEALQNLLANSSGFKNKEYIKGVMLEYQNEFPTLNTLKEKQAHEEMMKGVSEEAKKEIDDLVKEYDKEDNPWSFKYNKPNDVPAFKLRAIVHDNIYSEDERNYGREVLNERHISIEKPSIKVPKLTSEQEKEIEKDADSVRNALQGYTDSDEQEIIKDIIMNKVNSTNILEFLRKYTYSDFSDKQGLFRQLTTEYGFEDKGVLLKHLATCLVEHCEKYERSDASHISDVRRFANSANSTSLSNVYITSMAQRVDDFVSQEVQIRHRLLKIDKNEVE